MTLYAVLFNSPTCCSSLRVYADGSCLAVRLTINLLTLQAINKLSSATDLFNIMQDRNRGLLKGVLETSHMEETGKVRLHAPDIELRAVVLLVNASSMVYSACQSCLCL